MSATVHENLNYVCPRVQRIFEHFAANPRTIQHLLLYGSPGSGKTSTTLWLLKKIWGDDPLFSRVCFILNAADERSLEAIRAKCIPFIEVDWREKGETRPRFLVLDECETLTDSAQLALRPFLDNDPSSLCVIFLCNSQVKVHESICNATLNIRFNPPTRCDSGISSYFYRGDLRQLQVQKPTFRYIHNFINNMPYAEYSPEEFMSALIFFLNFTCLVDVPDILKFIELYTVNQTLEYISQDHYESIYGRFRDNVLLPKIDSFKWSQEWPKATQH